ncbi:MAG: CpaF family protein [Anaerolineales bacterium]|nr:MAG: CpaF family protein [Chloroflexota bacterium]MBE7435179.1 CpaF family protein [Anaerolineales bacterium]MCE7858459.1 CpaF family protein [Chloroflexi bacterium CFX2]MCK6582025.1 CpaF family protein [Anaerolineales bacterium]GJQ37029.1 MAG: type II secretion system protein E [Anaerolineaceae bacterium]
MSLLRRIEQGQGSGSQQTPSSPAQVPPKTGGEGQGTSGGGGDSSRLSSLQARRVSAPITSPQAGSYFDLKTRVQNKLLAEIDPSMDVTRTDEVRRTIQNLFEQILTEENIVLSRPERARLFEQISAEILGFGPLQSLLEDDTITEIMVNGPKNVYIERKGKVHRVPITFENNDHVMRIIDRIVAPLGRRIDESSPYVDARLPDGSRVNAVIPPISLVGPVLTIRKFSKNPITVDQMIQFGSVSPESVQFLKACVEARLNIIISGGTGSGKTTLLNVLSGFIPSDERIITIENAAELQLRQEHVVTLESRPPNIEGRGEITIRDLVINALRMRPERIIVGECRGGETLDMLQAMNTGHDGSMTTAHANSPRDALARIETMCLMAGMDLPVRAIREQVASAVDVICQQERMRDGTRKVVTIAEVSGMEGDVITMTDIFIFEQTGTENGRIVGRLRPTGLRPKFMDKIEAAGIHLPPSIFGIGERRRY